nr:hypothetical protein [Tanacetum cinerariifolium]
MDKNVELVFGSISWNIVDEKEEDGDEEPLTPPPSTPTKDAWSGKKNTQDEEGDKAAATAEPDGKRSDLDFQKNKGTPPPTHPGKDPGSVKLIPKDKARGREPTKDGGNEKILWPLGREPGNHNSEATQYCLRSQGTLNRKPSRLVRTNSQMESPHMNFPSNVIR